MPGAYTVTTRTTGQTLTASIYNADHQNHIDHLEPAYIDDASTNLAAMQGTTDPGELSAESLATTLTGEIQRLRYALQEAKAALDPHVTRWYETPYGPQVANVKGYGATGDGTTNDRATIQACLDANLRVYFPPGTYLISGANSQAADGLQLRTGHELFGSGWTSILKQDTNCYYVASVNQYNGGTTAVSGNIANVRIHDLQFKSTVDVTGLKEHYHQVNLNAASDVLIERCKFYGMFGDGLYIGSGNQAGLERHNERITVRQCLFDGGNKANRNGISILDCDGCVIDDCYFTNLSAANMPGAIDIEPNTGVAYCVLRHLLIQRCKFYNIGSTANAAINALLPDATFTTAPESFIISENEFDACPFALAWSYPLTGGITSQTADFDLQFTRNRVRSCVRPFVVWGLKGARIEDNTFSDCTRGGIVGYTAVANKSRDIVVRDNTFREVGTTDGIGMQIFNADQIDIVANRFQDCGVSGGGSGYAVDFNTGTSTYVRIENNLITTPNSKTTIAVVKEAGHTLTPATNSFLRNQLSGLSHSFTAYQIDAIGVTETFDTTTLPDTFPVGISTTIINGDTGAPDASTQGTLTTYKYRADSSFRKFVYQLYKGADNSASSSGDLWVRAPSTAANTWDTWRRVSEHVGSGAFAAANGDNDDCAMAVVGFIRISTPTLAFAIRGITNGIGGRQLTIHNATGANMTISNENAGSTAANRINTVTGADVVLTGQAVANLIYSGTDARWVLTGTQG